MQNKGKVFTSIALLALLVGFAASPIPLSDPAKPLQLDATATQLTLKLAANPTTGYLWRLVAYDQKLFPTVTHQYFPPNTQLVGAGGFEIWHFTVDKIVQKTLKKTQIQLNYVRPWEKQPGQTVIFTVDVK